MITKELANNNNEIYSHIHSNREIMKTMDSPIDAVIFPHVLEYIWHLIFYNSSTLKWLT